MKQEIALNLEPGDEIRVDGNWWVVQRHSVDMNAPAPVQLALRSRDDPGFNSTMLCLPTFSFPTEKACG